MTGILSLPSYTLHMQIPLCISRAGRPQTYIENTTTSTLELTREVFKREIGSCSCVETANQLSDCIDDTVNQKTVATVNCSKYYKT